MFSTYFIILCPVLTVIIPALLTSAFHQALASLPASLLASALQTAASPPARIQRCPYTLHTLRKERHCLRESWPCCCGHCLQGRTHEAMSELPHETGLILRCARKIGNPLQTEKGSRSWAISAYSAANQPLHRRVIIVCQPLELRLSENSLRPPGWHYGSCVDRLCQRGQSPGVGDRL